MYKLGIIVIVMLIVQMIGAEILSFSWFWLLPVCLCGDRTNL